MSDAVQTVRIDEQLHARMGQVRHEIFGDSERRCEPQRVTGKGGIGGDEVRGELTGVRMHDEARVAVSKLAGDSGVFFLVTADGAHRGQAARDRVRAGRDGLTEGQMRKGGHLGERAKEEYLKR